MEWEEFDLAARAVPPIECLNLPSLFLPSANLPLPCIDFVPIDATRLYATGPEHFAIQRINALMIL